MMMQPRIGTVLYLIHSKSGEFEHGHNVVESGKKPKGFNGQTYPG